MAIPQEHNWRYIFHFTDIRNLDSIIKNGVLCTNDKKEKGITHKNIANATIQERRAKMDVPIGKKGKVHDYVPFYFSSMNPMLLTLLNHKNVDQNLIINAMKDEKRKALTLKYRFDTKELYSLDTCVFIMAIIMLHTIANERG